MRRWTWGNARPDRGGRGEPGRDRGFETGELCGGIGEDLPATEARRVHERRRHPRGVGQRVFVEVAHVEKKPVDQPFALPTFPRWPGGLLGDDHGDVHVGGSRERRVRRESRERAGEERAPERRVGGRGLPGHPRRDGLSRRFGGDVAGHSVEHERCARPSRPLEWICPAAGGVANHRVPEDPHEDRDRRAGRGAHAGGVGVGRRAHRDRRGLERAAARDHHDRDERRGDPAPRADRAGVHRAARRPRRPHRRQGQPAPARCCSTPMHAGPGRRSAAHRHDHPVARARRYPASPAVADLDPARLVRGARRRRGKHKINSAYKRGVVAAEQDAARRRASRGPSWTRGREAGRARSSRRWRSLTGISIDHYAEINLAGFVELTDALGGVPVCLNRARARRLLRRRPAGGLADRERRRGAGVRPPAPWPGRRRPGPDRPPAGVHRPGWTQRLHERGHPDRPARSSDGLLGIVTRHVVVDQGWDVEQRRRADAPAVAASNSAFRHHPHRPARPARRPRTAWRWRSTRTRCARSCASRPRRVSTSAPRAGSRRRPRPAAGPRPAAAHQDPSGQRRPDRRDPADRAAPADHRRGVPCVN